MVVTAPQRVGVSSVTAPSRATASLRDPGQHPVVTPSVRRDHVTVSSPGVHTPRQRVTSEGPNEASRPPGSGTRVPVSFPKSSEGAGGTKPVSVPQTVRSRQTPSVTGPVTTERKRHEALTIRSSGPPPVRAVRSEGIHTNGPVPPMSRSRQTLHTVEPVTEGRKRSGASPSSPPSVRTVRSGETRVNVPVPPVSRTRPTEPITGVTPLSPSGYANAIFGGWDGNQGFNAPLADRPHPLTESEVR